MPRQLVTHERTELSVGVGILQHITKMAPLFVSFTAYYEY